MDAPDRMSVNGVGMNGRCGGHVVGQAAHGAAVPFRRAAESARIAMEQDSSLLPFNACAALVVLVSICAAQPAPETGDANRASGPKDVPAAMDPLRGLDRFPYVVVVPKEGADGADVSGSVIIDQTVLDNWLSDRVDEILERSGAAARTRSRVTITIERDRAHIEAEIDVRVESSRGAWVPLGFREASFHTATLRERLVADTEPKESKLSDPWVPAMRKDQGGYRLRVDRAGAYVCRIDGDLPIERFPGPSTLRLSIPSFSVVTLHNDAPMESVRNAASGIEYDLSEDRRTASLSMENAAPLTLTWRESAAGRAGQISAAQGLLKYRVESGALRLEGILDLVAAGDVRQVEVRLPKGLRFLEIAAFQADAPLPCDVDVADEERDQRVLLKFSRIVADRLRLRLTAEAFRGTKDPLEVWALAVEGARQQSGTILLDWSPGLWVRPQTQPEIERTSVNELPADIQAMQPRQAYRYSTAPASLPLVVETARPALSLMARHELRIGPEKGEMISRFRLSVRGAQAESFTFRVPKDWTVVEAQPGVASMVEEAPSASSEARLMVVTLSEPIEDSDVDILLRGELPIATGGIHTLAIPTLEPVGFSNGTLSVYCEPEVRLSYDDSRSQYLQREPISQAPDEPSPYWMFRLQSGPSRLSFSVERLTAPTEVAVESEFRRTGQELQVRSSLRYRSLYSSFSELSLTIPTGIEDLNVSGDLLIEKPHITPGTAELRLRNPTRSCEVRVSYRYPLSPEQFHQVELPLVLPRAAVVSSWRGTVFCDRGWRSVALAPWAGSRPTPDELIGSGERPDLDIVLPNPSAVPQSLALRFEPTATLATLVIPRIAIEEITPSEGGRWGRKRWLIAKHRARDVSFRVPPGCTVRMTFLDGHSVEPIADASRTFRLRLPAVDEPCSLEVDYDFPDAPSDGAAAVRTWSGPTLVEDAAVEQVRWVFRVADDRLLARIGATSSAGSTWSFPGFLRETHEGIDGTADWLREIDPNVEWASLGLVATGGRAWSFETFGQADSLAVVSLREPFWVLLCSGTSFITLLALTRLRPMTQLRVGLVALLVIVGLLAAAPDLLGWLWLGGQWGVYVGLIAIALHYGLLYRRMRTYRVGLRRLRQRPAGLGSSLLRRLEPKTRVTSTPASQEV